MFPKRNWVELTLYKSSRACGDSLPAQPYKTIIKKSKKWSSVIHRCRVQYIDNKTCQVSAKSDKGDKI